MNELQERETIISREKYTVFSDGGIINTVPLTDVVYEIALESEISIKCQNCKKVLGTNYNDVITYNPSIVQSVVQELTKDTTLITMQCPGCGCLVQIKS